MSGPTTAAAAARGITPPEVPAEAERLARAWAEAHATAPAGAGGAAVLPSPLARLNGYTRQLRRAHQLFGRQSAATESESYAAEWFLDNYYLIREAIREVIQDLPADYYRRLPVLAAGTEWAGAPRALALAVELARECAGRVDGRRLATLLEAYQRVAPLQLGELWSLPSLLRLTLIAWLSESATSVTERRPDQQAPAVATVAPGGAPQGTRHRTDPLGDPAPVDTDHDQRVANCVAGLRALKTIAWDDLVERVSLCERELRADPSGDYERMTFETRDRYRKVVERLARRSGADELAVAREAVRLAATAREAGARPRTRHVGYWLMDEGVASLERRFGYRRSRPERTRAWVTSHPTLVYIGGVVTLAALLVTWGGAYAAARGGGGWLAALTLILLVVPALTAAVAVVNYAVTRMLEPRLLPRLDFRRGIPAGHETAVVMPVLLGSRADIDDLTSQLERHYLGNPDPRLRFALLTDFPDADAATLPGEADLLEHARRRVRALNVKHGSAEPRIHAGNGVAPAGPFYLLHRGRRWNPREGVWMGWERKRGKLMELNRLLRGATDTTYEVTVGDMGRLADVEFVLTLDADTRLPPGSAHRLVGTLAHPLNRAEFGPDDRVSAGYSLLQPRTDVLPESANASRFSRLFVGENGLDLYTLAVSDVYQDLFGAAIFVGKGLYRVDDFARAMEGRVPENSLLSHDLLEGIYGGVALVSDVVLYEEYPPTYLAQVKRAQRWVRGDWQLLPWLLATLVGARGGGRGERLGVAGAWKIADNLRRSLVAPTLYLLFVAGWVVLPGAPLVWTFIALSTLAAPLLAGAVIEYVGGLIKNEAVPGRRRLAAWQPLSQALGRFVITLSFVPYEAVMVAISVSVTLYRVFVTRRNLLTWRTAAETNTEYTPTLRGNARRMAGALVPIALAALLVASVRPSALPEAGAILVLWLLTPLTAYLLSLASTVTPRTPTAAEVARLHGLARRTWLFFERFVGPDDNWLPPDNVQVGPDPVTAHRTSPTNVGLMLLSTLAAHDLGYLGTVELSLRLRSSLNNLAGLERYRGHLLNWYDTRSLEPLAPRYVSSVDSGNLVAAFMALRQGCLRLLDEPIEPAACYRGLVDALAVLQEVVTEAQAGGGPLAESVAALRRRVELGVAGEIPLGELGAYLSDEGWPALERDLRAAMDEGAFTGEGLTATRLWAERVHHGILVSLRELAALTPWVAALGEATWAGELPSGSPAAAAFRAVRAALSAAPSLRGLGEWSTAAEARLRELAAAEGPRAPERREWCEALTRRLASSRQAAAGLVESFEGLATGFEEEIRGTDFAFLFDGERQLLHIGYNVDAEQLDGNYYDLLASESRLASLVGVAKHDLPVSHWLHLGRPLGDVDGRATLLSWSGTMFEYLMPPLLTRRYGATLIEQSCYAAVDVQIDYGRRHGVPWGVSESGYARVDAAGNYQYRAFGVPELALDRSYEGDLVVAPYATVLATPYRPQQALENLARLADLGALGPHGLYEALDFTPSRKPLGGTFALVRSHMAHHQGMAMVALTNELAGDVMVERFHADPRVATVELLLQERIPAEVPVVDEVRIEETPVGPVDVGALDRPWPVEVDTATPLCHLLSNGRYTVLASAAGGGWSTAGDVALTRWRRDGTTDGDGTWLFLTDLEGGAVWSATRQPLGRPAQSERVTFHPFAVEYQREVDGVLTRLEVTVGQDDVELRRLAVVNRLGRPRKLRVTSYAEVVLGSAAGDARHPAFSKLFVESRYDAARGALFFRRRPRAADERPLFAAHAVVLPAGVRRALQYESDRAAFLGRGNDIRNAAMLTGALGGGVGATLDPVMALAQPFELAAHSQLEFTFVTATADSRVELEALLDRVMRPGMVAREFGLARMRSRLELRQHDLDPGKVETYQRLYSAVLYPDPALRAPAATLAANTLGQSSLWGQGISGDLPILVVRIGDPEQLPLVVELLRAHAFWRRRGVKVDLVVLNAKDTTYDQGLHARLRGHLSRTGGDEWLNARGGIFLLRQDQLAPVDLTLLETSARVLLEGARGTLEAQLGPLRAPIDPGLPVLTATRDPEPAREARPPRADLVFDNGWGGFTKDGREYVIAARRGDLPPAPWSNVIANPELGCLTTEAGMGATWAVNSGENRLTPWSNDPVSDPPSEVVYLRDEETTEVWSATPHPAGAAATFTVRHGAGSTVWSHDSHGLAQTLTVSVAQADPVKLVHLEVRNRLDRPRRVTVTYYAPWVLGVDRATTGQYVQPGYDPERCVLLARNPYAAEFGGRVAFLASNKSPHGVTTDRREFLGRLGDPAAPDALRRIGLSGATAPGGDPCAALQLHLDLPAGGAESVLFALGQGEGRDAALELAQRYRNIGEYDAVRAAASAWWDERLDRVGVTTPDPALDLLTNRWLLYQTISCRYFGRTAFYQPGGAYGFRDQLQDVVALLHAAPELAREQLLRAAAHQFEEGDVLHWWHPPSGRGVRTRISDDLLWLVYATERYVTTTGDVAVLGESVPFLHGPALKDGEEERYDQFGPGDEAGTLLEHCRRAMQRGATRGVHGLPLMGTGDWNDGMNRVGAGGKGESVWLAWFALDAAHRFAALLEVGGGPAAAEEAATWRRRAEAYGAAVEASAWDGDWYLRAFFDDGSPLGGHANQECRIDSIAQSWGILSGAAPRERALRAMRSVDEQCVRREDGLIRLFTPPFDKTPRDPGYIKGYLPGVRENGGQYTHGVIWSAWAFAELGDGGAAHALHQLIDPVMHSSDREGALRFKVEPYVITADVYSLPPHVGRGGWSWYTGSAAWFYRFGLEGLLGLERVGDELRVTPRVPPEWPGFEVRYRYGASSYVLRAKRVDAPPAVGDGAAPGARTAAVGAAERAAPAAVVKLIDDGREHVVDVGYAG